MVPRSRTKRKKKRIRQVRHGGEMAAAKNLLQTRQTKPQRRRQRAANGGKTGRRPGRKRKIYWKRGQRRGICPACLRQGRLWFRRRPRRQRLRAFRKWFYRSLQSRKREIPGSARALAHGRPRRRRLPKWHRRGMHLRRARLASWWRESRRSRKHLRLQNRLKQRSRCPTISFPRRRARNRSITWPILAW